MKSTLDKLWKKTLKAYKDKDSGSATGTRCLVAKNVEEKAWVKLIRIKIQVLPLAPVA